MCVIKWEKKNKLRMLVAQSRPTLCNPMNYSPPGSPVHEILQAKNSGIGSHSLLQRIFLTQGSNSALLHHGSLPSEPTGKPLWMLKQLVKCLFFFFFFFFSYQPRVTVFSLAWIHENHCVVKITFNGPQRRGWRVDRQGLYLICYWWDFKVKTMCK